MSNVRCDEHIHYDVTCASISDCLVYFVTRLIIDYLSQGCTMCCSCSNQVTLHALVTPLHKRHGLDTNNLANYRPVSNIGFVSKVLERYVANAMREHVDNNGYNDAFQSAYRPRHSTETALVRIHNDLMQSMNCRRGVLLAVFCPGFQKGRVPSEKGTLAR